MKRYEILDYIKAGCEELKHKAMVGVFGITDGKICDTGCHAYNNGNCKAYKNLINDRTDRKMIEPTETVRNEAKRRSISISEVRRQRRAVFKIFNKEAT